jgi:hypothetical protein
MPFSAGNEIELQEKSVTDERHFKSTEGIDIQLFVFA